MEARRCELCGREAHRLERHHLIPRTTHRNKRNKKSFARKDVRGRILMLCSPCHKQLHATFAEKQLEYEYNTLAAIRAHPDIRKFVRWVRRRPADAGIRVRPKGGNDLRREENTRRQRRSARQREREQ